MGIAILTAFLLYFATLFGIALVTYVFFWYETANSSHLDHLRLISKNRVGRWLAKGIAFSILSQNLTFLLYPLRFWRKLWQPEPDPACTRPPVILIHGLYHNASAWILYQSLLKQKGFHNTYAFSYKSVRMNIETLSQKLDGKVDEVRSQLSDQRVVLIGHSLGGFLAKAYVDHGANSDKVAAVITLGSPHQGSKLAVFGVGRLARSLSYRGKWFQELKQNSRDSGIPRLAIYSPIDNMVLPNESLHVDQPGWSHLESYPLSHVAMLYYRPLAKLVIEYLQVRAMSADEDFDTQPVTAE